MRGMDMALTGAQAAAQTLISACQHREPQNLFPLYHHNVERSLLWDVLQRYQHVPALLQRPGWYRTCQHDVMPAFEAGLLDRDCVVVVRHQGPKANGMPELHKLMPPLGVLLDRCFKIALVTDGRLSGASGKVPSAIHVTPEAYDGGLLI